MSISSIPGYPLFDAHCHVYDDGLCAALEDYTGEFPQPVIRAQLINGTKPSNWRTVADYRGMDDTKAVRAYGVHPWNVDNLPEDWEQQLRRYLDKDAVSVGEIGLDCWIEPRDDDLQRSVFVRQLELAFEYGLPPSIHCVRAYGAVLDVLRQASLPDRGFLTHGFAGSKEVLFQLLDKNGYVSFSAYGAHPGRKRIRDAIRYCPLDRLLVETDAPHMVPPEDICRYPLKDESGNRLHHPAELLTAYEWISELKKIKLSELVDKVQENFARLFPVD